MSLYISGINLADLAGVFRAQVIEQDGKKVVEFTAVDDPHYTLTGEITDVQPHGDLIDRAVLSTFKELKADVIYHETVIREYVSMAAVNTVKAIIKAEEGEHTMAEFMYGYEGNPIDGSM